jgi:hypothetical protein
MALNCAIGSKKDNNMETYQIEYGLFTVTYRIESDVDGNKAIITGIIITGETTDDIALFDVADWNDIKFHCESDFGDRQTAHYLKTGNSL